MAEGGELVTDIKKVLDEKGVYVSKTMGNSMEPMLVQGRDTVIIKKPVFPLKKFDVPVYRRKDHYTMHRIIKVTPKGYVICGDNRPDREYDITEKDIVGVLEGFYQGDRYIECGSEEELRYARQAQKTYPKRAIRHLVFKAKRKLKRILKEKEQSGCAARRRRRS